MPPPLRNLSHLEVATALLQLLAALGCATSSPAAGPTGTPGPGAPAATPAGITFTGGDGHDCQHRVVVHGAAGELDGVAAEYDWLSRKYPGYKRRMQGLTKCEGLPADELTSETASGQSFDVYFDISEFFGKGL